MEAAEIQRGVSCYPAWEQLFSSMKAAVQLQLGSSCDPTWQQM